MFDDIFDFDELLDSVKELVKSKISLLTDRLKPSLLLDRLSPTKYDPPYIEMTIGGESLDIKNHLKSIEITKRPGGVFDFSLELFDPTFLFEGMLLKHRVPITIKYGSLTNYVHYKGTILNSKSTIKLSTGVEISSVGILSSVSFTDNQPREFKVTEYKGSVLAILSKLCEDLNINFVVRDDVKDVIITDDEGLPRTVLSGTNATDLDLIKSLVDYLGEETNFTILPAEVNSTDPRETLMIFNMNNAETGLSKTRNLIVADLNHRDSIVESYDFEITQTQFDLYGGNEKYTSTDPMTNDIVSVEGDVNSRTHNEFMQDMYDGASKVIHYLSTSSSNKKNMEKRVQRRITQKINATYNVTLNLISSTPDVLPFFTELEINSYISSPSSKLSSMKHHTSGKYTITEVKDMLSPGLFRQTITAFRCGGGVIV